VQYFLFKNSRSEPSPARFLGQVMALVGLAFSRVSLLFIRPIIPAATPRFAVQRAWRTPAVFRPVLLPCWKLA